MADEFVGPLHIFMPSSTSMWPYEIRSIQIDCFKHMTAAITCILRPLVTTPSQTQFR